MTPTPEAIEAMRKDRMILTMQDAARKALSASGDKRAVYSPVVLKAILAAYESAMEAAGFVRVPVEPTEAMTLRGVHGCSCGAAHSGVPTYRAMIAARPSANKGGRG